MAGSRGMSLVETLVMISLFLLLGGALWVSFLTGQREYVTSDSRIHVQEEARRAFDNMVRELRESANITCAPNCTTANRINFQVTMGYANGVVALGDGVNQNVPAGTQYYAHYLVPAAGTTGSLLRCTTASASPGNPSVAITVNPIPASCRVLANNVNGSTSSFAWSAASWTVTCRLQLTYANSRVPGGAMTSPLLTSQVRLRN